MNIYIRLSDLLIELAIRSFYEKHFRIKSSDKKRPFDGPSIKQETWNVPEDRIIMIIMRKIVKLNFQNLN